MVVMPNSVVHQYEDACVKLYRTWLPGEDLRSVLEERGFVARTPDPRDGRRQIVAITDAGRDLLESSRAAGEGWLAGVISERLTEAECATLVEAMALLDRVAER